MEPAGERRRRRGRAAGRNLICLIPALGTILASSPARAEETAGRESGETQAAPVRDGFESRDTTFHEVAVVRDTTSGDSTLRARPGPVRKDRFPATLVLDARPAVARGDDPARRTAAFDAPLAMLEARASTSPIGDASRSTWAVAGAAVAGSALGWAVGATGGLLLARDRLARDDLGALLYAAVGGVAVSVPAGALSAHWASGGRGSVLTSTLLGYAVAGATILVWPDGGWALGPALAIPIAIVVEAP